MKNLILPEWSRVAVLAFVVFLAEAACAQDPKGPDVRCSDLSGVVKSAKGPEAGV